MVRINHNHEDKVIAFSREKDGHAIISMINFSKEKLTIKIKEKEYSGYYIDWFTKEEIDVKNLSQVVLQPWGYKIFSSIPKNA